MEAKEFVAWRSSPLASGRVCLIGIRRDGSEAKIDYAFASEISKRTRLKAYVRFIEYERAEKSK